MELIDNTINNLEQIKDKSSLKVFLEEYKKMYEQLSEERDYRIRLIEELKNNLLKVRKNNLEIEATTNFKKLKETYRINVRKAGDTLLFLIGICGHNREEAYKKHEEKISELKKQCANDLNGIGYVQDEIVSGQEYKIDDYIKDLYRKYVCEEFGHEYVRHYNGKVEVEMEDFRGAEYEVDAFERHTGRLLDAGSPGTPMVICKYCGEKIYKENILNPDFKDKQKILLPLSELNKERK